MPVADGLPALDMLVRLLELAVLLVLLGVVARLWAHVRRQDALAADAAAALRELRALPGVLDEHTERNRAAVTEAAAAICRAVAANGRGRTE